MEYILDQQNNRIKLFHGTNRQFNHFSKDKARTELNQNYQGDWFCFSPKESVAWKYADAARNQNFDKDIFFEESKTVFSKLDKDKKELMLYFTKSIHSNGYSKGYDCAFDYYKNKHNIKEQHEYKTMQVFKEIEKELGFDLDDFAHVIENVEYCKQDDTPDSIQDLFNMLNSQTNKISEEDIKTLNKLGYVKTLPEPKIFEVEIKANKVLKTKNREKAKAAINNGYDLVIYNGTDLVHGIEEYLVADDCQINIKSITRRIEKREKLDNNEEYDEKIHYTYKKEIIKNKDTKKNRNRPR